MEDYCGMLGFQRCSKKNSMHTCPLKSHQEWTEYRRVRHNLVTAQQQQPRIPAWWAVCLPDTPPSSSVLTQGRERGLGAAGKIIKWSLWRGQVSDPLKSLFQVLDWDGNCIDIMHACVPSHFSCVWLFACPWTMAYQAPLSMGILQERTLEWVAVPSSRDLAEPGIKPRSLMSPALADGFFTPSATAMARYSYLWLDPGQVGFHPTAFGTQVPTRSKGLHEKVLHLSSIYHSPQLNMRADRKNNPPANPHFPLGFPQIGKWKASCNLLKVNCSKNLQILSMEDQMLQSKGMRMFNLTGKESSTLQNHQNSLSLCFYDRKPPSLTLEAFIQKSKVLVLHGLGP